MQTKMLAGQVAVVTGASSGLGVRFAKILSEAGASVALMARRTDRLDAVVAEIKAAGGVAQAFKCNITDRAEVDAAVAAAEAALGPIAVLVNNAGWDVFKPFTKTVPAEWEKLIAINLTGALHMLHAVLPGMAERKYGRIVNIASDAARGGSSGEAVYSACKGGLVALSKTLAREHARQSITVNVVCPGPTDTALLAGVAEGARDPAKLIEAFKSAIPLGRLGQPADLASAIAFFGSDDASFITGQVISVSGGLTMHG